MLTLPAPNATRTTTPSSSSLVVRLQLPGPDSPGSSRPLTSGSLDLERLARAVEDLVRAVAPEVVTQVTVEEPAPRPRLHAAPEPPAAEPEPVTGDPVRLDRESRILTVDGRPVELTRREFDLLAYLRQRRTVALSRRELMNAVWQTGYLAGDRTIDVHVRRLRVKLGRHADRLTTLRGFGYRFD
jgi:DNA-binding response OmpR family regulator